MNTLHLFAGAGGGIIADVFLGFRTVGAVEIDPYCRRVLYQRQQDGYLPKFPIYRDIRLFNGNEIRKKVDIICGGFPCQDISSAGKKVGIRGERSGLFFELIRICRNIRPQIIFLENVAAIIDRGIDTVLGEISCLGYDAAWYCLSAQSLGAPHVRDRWWCLCTPSDNQGECTQSDGAREISNPLRGGLETLSKIMEGAIHQFGSLCGSDFGAGWWQVKPRIERVAPGVAHRVDRLKAVGNGQVPICATVAFIELLGRVINENEYDNKNRKHQ